MEMKQILHGSADYERMISLRIRNLLAPSGIPSSFIRPEKEKSDLLLCSFEEGEMTGCCVLTKIDEQTVQLRQMAVEENFRGRGLGAFLLDYADKVALENGYSNIMLHAREGVRGFYGRSGYQQTGDPFDEVGIVHYKMIKSL
jgi:predicted GNAT family N-acyltransferase